MPSDQSDYEDLTPRVAEKPLFLAKLRGAGLLQTGWQGPVLITRSGGVRCIHGEPSTALCAAVGHRSLLLLRRLLGACRWQRRRQRRLKMHQRRLAAACSVINVPSRASVCVARHQSHHLRRGCCRLGDRGEHGSCCRRVKTACVCKLGAGRQRPPGRWWRATAASCERAERRRRLASVAACRACCCCCCFCSLHGGGGGVVGRFKDVEAAAEACVVQRLLLG